MRSACGALNSLGDILSRLTLDVFGLILIGKLDDDTLFFLRMGKGWGVLGRRRPCASHASCLRIADCRPGIFELIRRFFDAFCCLLDAFERVRLAFLTRL